MKTILTVVAMILAVAAESGARQPAIKIAFADGRVSLAVEEARASDVLAEWARVGRTEMKGIELLEKRVISLRLSDVSEGEALQAILGEGFGYVGSSRKAELGLSTFERLVIGATDPPAEEPFDPSVPPEARYSYYLPEKTMVTDGWGAPSWPQIENPKVPEAMFDYFTPETSVDGFGAPTYTQLDESWRAPETRFEYFSKVFDVEMVKPSYPPLPKDWTDPEKRFKYYVPAKAGG